MYSFAWFCSLFSVKLACAPVLQDDVIGYQWTAAEQPKTEADEGVFAVHVPVRLPWIKCLQCDAVDCPLMGQCYSVCPVQSLAAFCCELCSQDTPSYGAVVS